MSSNGSYSCWGHGYSTTPPSYTSSGIIDLDCGEDHCCFVQSNGKVKCGGQGVYGEIGDGNTYLSGSNSTYTNPVEVSGISNAKKVSCGRHHSCALLNDGTVFCWGLNSSGQLGDGTTTNRLTPVQVVNISNAIDIGDGHGHNHTCIIDVSNNIKCWGYGGYGQLGNASSSNSSVPVNVIK